jgi:NDP-sugar pyrophosphorylase family protein
MVNLPPVLILVGGLGTRLRSVINDRPKALAEIDGVSFLEIQLTWLDRQGFQEIILLTGYGAEQISDYVRIRKKSNLRLCCVRERQPLGTGGAVLNALNQLQLRKPFLLLNGDSLTEISLREFCMQAQTTEQARLVVAYQKDAGQFGKVEFDENGRLLSFKEKTQKSEQGWVSTGIYYFPANWFFGRITDATPLSLEKDLIPAWLAKSLILQVFPVQANFADIGTPESYRVFARQAKNWDLTV